VGRPKTIEKLSMRAVTSQRIDNTRSFIQGVFSAMEATLRVSLFPWIASELPNSAFAFAFSEPENQITNYETKTDRYDHHGAVFMRPDDELR
jgi:hypothetical protein